MHAIRQIILTYMYDPTKYYQNISKGVKLMSGQRFDFKSSSKGIA